MEMSMKNMNRREVIELAAKATASLVVATQIPIAMGMSKSPPYGGYSGHPDYPYLTKPATVFDFGLTPDQEARAAELHKNIIVFDGLMECSIFPNLVPLLKQGGATSGNLSIGISGISSFTPDNVIKPEDWWTWRVLEADLKALPKVVNDFPDAVITLNHADILAAKKAGKVGMMPGTQNTQFLGRDTSYLKKAYDMGLRIIQLTYNPTNFVGSGSLEKVDARYGLSTLGERVVEEMNALGMLIDTGHCSPETMIKAAEVSTKPIAISHAGMISKVNQFRATSDKALKTVADKGGVYGVISTPAAIAGSDRCTVNDYLDNIEYAINMVGVEHVGFGSDFIQPATFEQILTAPAWDPKIAASIGSFDVWPWSDGHVGWENGSAYPNMTRGLIKRGYSDSDIAKIMGGNFMRVIKDTIG
tara:strand:- start:2316 stop:3566 length:1251 start_codon:yes stop_codon:yes gene_type:complete